MSWLTGTVILLCLTFGLSHAILEEPTPTTIKDHGGDFIYFLVLILPAFITESILFSPPNWKISKNSTSLKFSSKYFDCILFEEFRKYSPFFFNIEMKIFSIVLVIESSNKSISTCSAWTIMAIFPHSKRWKLISYRGRRLIFSIVNFEKIFEPFFLEIF